MLMQHQLLRPQMWKDALLQRLPRFAWARYMRGRLVQVQPWIRGTGLQRTRGSRNDATPKLWRDGLDADHGCPQDAGHARLPGGLQLER